MKRILPISLLGIFLLYSVVWAQNAPKAPQVSRLSDTMVQIGNIVVDLKQREATVAGKVTPATILEFLACNKGGFKAYESALELDTDSITFNTAMILIGLDQANAVPAKSHFDPNPPQGDPVEIWVEWESSEGKKRVHAEDILYSQKTKGGLPLGSWVYTGSVFRPDGKYVSELDGVLIGFVRDPAAIIDSNLSNGPGLYGGIRVSPELSAGMAVKLTVKALPLQKK